MGIRQDTYQQTFNSIRDNVAAGLKESWNVVGDGKPATPANIYSKADELMNHEGEYFDFNGKQIPTNKTAHEIAERTSNAVATNAPDFSENFWGALMAYIVAAFTWIFENISSMFTGEPARSFAQIMADNAAPGMQQAVGQSLSEMAADPKHEKFFRENNLVEKAMAQVKDGVDVAAGVKEAPAAFDLKNVKEGKGAPVEKPKLDDKAPKEEQIRTVLAAAAAPLVELAKMDKTRKPEDIEAIKNSLLKVGTDIALSDEFGKMTPEQYADAVLTKGLPELKDDGQKKLLKTQLVKALMEKPGGSTETLYESLVTASGKTLSNDDKAKLANVKIDYAGEREALGTTIYTQTFNATMEAIDRKAAQGLYDKKGTFGGRYYTPPKGKTIATMTHQELLEDPKFITARDEYARGYGLAPNGDQQVAISHIVALATRDAVLDEKNKGLNKEQMAEAVAKRVEVALSASGAESINKTTNENFSTPLPEKAMLNNANPKYYSLFEGQKGLAIPAGWAAVSYTLDKPSKGEDETVEMTNAQRIATGVKTALLASPELLDQLVQARDANTKSKTEEAQQLVANNASPKPSTEPQLNDNGDPIPGQTPAPNRKPAAPAPVKLDGKGVPMGTNTGAALGQ